MQVEKFHWKTEEAFTRIKSGQPVVLQECPIVFPHHENWTVERLLNIIEADFPCTVYVSPDNRFPYWDATKNTFGYKFQPHFTKETMTMGEFHRRFLLQKSLSPEDVREYCYLNQSLVAEMGPRILEEYSKFSLQTAALYKVLAGWNEMMHNLLMIGGEGYITSLHYDEVENIFTQLQGRKRVRLFPADCWPYLYPYPVGHPRDRQCQVTLPTAVGSSLLPDPHDRIRFPDFPKAAPHELYVDLEPGELLYIPQYWFHQMEALTDNISLSWWFKHTSRKDVDYKLVDLNKITFSAVRRNIEGVMAHMVGGGRRAHELFLAIASGRLRVPGVRYHTAASSSSSSSSSTIATITSNSASTTTTVAAGSSSSSSSGSSQRRIHLSSSSSSTTSSSYENAVGDDEHISDAPTVTLDDKPTMLTTSTSSSSSLAVSTSVSARAEYVSSITSGSTSLLVTDTDAGALFLPAAADEEKWKYAVDQALSMLRTLFPPEVAAVFLLQVAVGRFSAEELQQTD